MSAQNPSSVVEWYQNLPLPWLHGPNGTLEGNTWPAVVDGEIALLKQAAKVAFPDYAPADALPHIGGDRGLVQGPAETNANFITRLKSAWDDWARAGTALELLVQLYWEGFGYPVLVQQNGPAYQLSPAILGSGAPTAGQDPTSLLAQASCSTLATALTSSVTPPTASSAGRSIPAANSWWTFDSNTDMCSRFALVYNAPDPSFYTVGRATFTNAKTATLTWSHSFPDTTYLTLPGNAVITDGSPGVAVSLDGTSLTLTGATVNATDAFSGWVDVLAWQAGANPLADIHPADLARLRTAIQRWRRGVSTCVGVYVVVQGACWGRPIIVQSFGSYQMAASTWGTRSWGPSTVVAITGSI